MGNKKTSVTYKGINRDIAKSKFTDQHYFDAENIKLTPVEGQTFGAVSNAYGNKLVLTLPTPTIDIVGQYVNAGDQSIFYTNAEINDLPESGEQKIIGNANTKDGFLLFSTDDNGFDCIWEITNSEADPLEYKLLYVRDLGFSTERPIEAIFNYENVKLQKVFWVDGTNYLRYINIAQSIENGHDINLIDLTANSVNSKSTFDVSQPKVVSAGGGGIHTAGVIQYGYTLYNLNGSETSLSPFSNLYPLDKGPNLGGGEINEIVGAMPVVQIENLDRKYSFLKLFSIKYTDYNTLPSINLVYDGGIGNHNKFTFNDTGSRTLGSMGVADFLFLGADAVKPKHIASKENILFIANNTTTAYKIDLDTRAYSFNQAGTNANIYNNITYTGVGDIPYTGDLLNAKDNFANIPDDFDCVNLDFDTYRYMEGAVVGGDSTFLNEGVYGASFQKEALEGADPTSITVLPISAVNGETSITGGEIVLNTIGEINLNITSVCTIADQPPVANYELLVMKNGVAISTFSLSLNTTGTSAQTFSLNVNLVGSDKLSLAVLNNNLGTLEESWDVNIAGTISVESTVAAGSNGEGGTGKYLSYELSRTSEAEVNTKVDKFYKDNEIYRIGLLFRNALGQESEAKWIADFKAPQGNLQKQYNTLTLHFNDAFYEWVDTLAEENKPVNYSILRAIRTENDKTIVTQGLLTGMMAQVKTRDIADYNNFNSRSEANSSLLKVPQIMTRGYGMGGSGTNSYYPLYPSLHNKEMGTHSIQVNDRQSHLSGAGYREAPDNWHDNIASEIFTDDENSYRTHATWQYTKLMQLHSPEAAFQIPINTTNTDELIVLGRMKRSLFEWKEQETRSDTLVVENTTHQIYQDGASGNFAPDVFRDGETYNIMVGGSGVIGPCFRNWSRDGDNDTDISKLSRQIHTHKTFDDLIRTENSYEIYGTPEVTETGQAPKFYNNDPSLKYANRLITIISDTKEDEHNRGWTDELGASSVETESNRCITIALGDTLLDSEQRPALEDLWATTSGGSSDWDVELFAEIRRSKEFIYSGALYSGYDSYSRSITEYVNVATFDIGDNSQLVSSPGDTFVQLFKNTRLTRTPGSVYAKTSPIICETLDYLVETTVNLEERNDLSIGPWGKTVDPFAEEANNYNKVYSTDPTLKTYMTDNLKINVINQLDTQVMASKPKIPGEFVESWVDFRPNEVQNLDGKYGPINALVSQWDELYTFQDFGVAKLSINPRVQVQGGDGVAIELGTGQVLHDYQYITTKAGSVNKWGITPSNSGIYFLDATTKQMYRIGGEGIGAVSETKGLHTFFYKNVNKTQLEKDNPITGDGISTGVDIINGDVYTTVKDSINGDYTVAFNEKINAFTSFYSFTPSRYIVKGDKLFTTSSNNNELWLHYEGDYQRYYGTKYESNITLLINTDDVHAEKVFNNIEFDSEVSLDDVDIDSSTIDSIEAWNDYQQTGKIPLIVGDNIRRRMRTWKTTIPRQSTSRSRMRDKWIFLKLGFNPGSNYKLVLHDIIVGYSQQ